MKNWFEIKLLLALVCLVGWWGSMSRFFSSCATWVKGIIQTCRLLGLQGVHRARKWKRRVGLWVKNLKGLERRTAASFDAFWKKLKNTGKGVLKWIRNHWKITLGLVILIGALWLLFGVFDSSQRSSLIEHLQDLVGKTMERKDKELEELDRIRQEETRKKTEIEQDYRDQVKEIRIERKDKLRQIDEEHQKVYHDLVNLSRGNPDAMAKQARDFWGFAQ